MSKLTEEIARAREVADEAWQLYHNGIVERSSHNETYRRWNIWSKRNRAYVHLIATLPADQADELAPEDRVAYGKYLEIKKANED